MKNKMLKDPSYIYKIGNHDMYPLPFLPGGWVLAKIGRTGDPNGGARWMRKSRGGGDEIERGIDVFLPKSLTFECLQETLRKSFFFSALDYSLLFFSRLMKYYIMYCTVLYRVCLFYMIVNISFAKVIHLMRWVFL